MYINMYCHLDLHMYVYVTYKYVCTEIFLCHHIQCMFIVNVNIHTHVY